MAVADRFRVTDIVLEIWKPLTAPVMHEILVTLAYAGWHDRMTT